MIDLNGLWDSVNYSVEQERKTIFMEPRIIMEVLRRAIAAESERNELKAKLEFVTGEREYFRSECGSSEQDVEELKGLLAGQENVNEGLIIEIAELKSKLSQFEREIPKTPEGFPELDKEHLIKICIQQQSKLAEIEAQEPVGVTDSFGNLKTYKKQLPVSANIYAKPIANNSEDAHPVGVVAWESWRNTNNTQRITEQDAREIARSLWSYLRGEVTPKIGALLSEDKWFDFKGRTLLAKLNEHREPVTPNKAEVPEGYVLVPKVIPDYLIHNFRVLAGPCIAEFDIKGIIEAFISMLPPLKDE